ncbi:putative ion transporter superfamily protein YfcC [Virgibacillus natechei]|uniref:Ion transporter superfamily protein YfcC n=1 Tax=Virgibacillus natechei TaxID=1216297 RepID=A0ABS4IC00_9BACI|nr:YfcC family protein [Virgibacillus natechei]MBP1968462.1 putative ion transporter superfamily protein YfcC [Virgibacillus natechei]UZD13583.1 YfcC family protein [Virgibacillus natechei]
MNKEDTSKKKIEFPHVFVILFCIILIASVFTYFIPAGEYERETTEDGVETVVDGTYGEVESEPIGFFEIFQSIHAGMVEGAEIIFFIFIVGGAFGIMNATNALTSAFGSLSRKLAGKELFLIPITMTAFAIGGATFGMAEETIPFIIILIPIAMMVGFDSMVGTAMVLIGVYAGFTAAFMNPFTVGVAQGIAGLPTFSGMGIRAVFFVVFLSVSILYVMRYARKVKKDPLKSMVYEEDQRRDVKQSLADQAAMTKRQGAIIGVLILTIIGLALGVTIEGWYMREIAGLFFLMGIVIGLIAKMRVNEIATSFLKGCEELVLGALVVGFAYGILVVLEDTNTIDTILYGISSLVSGLPTGLTAMGMLVTQSLLNFVVPSGSGQAALSMPIMAPLGDLVGVDRQTAVLAFQFGDGISNILTPTAGVLMAALALAKISWVKWVKWVWPLIVIWYVLGAIFVTVVHMFIW